MPLSDFRVGSGQRVHAGKKGKLYPPPGKVGGGGAIYVSRAAVRGPDAHLWAALKVAVDVLDLAIQVNSIDTGQHSPNSRHYAGLAVDINKVGERRDSWQQATMTNPFAVELVDLFLHAGWQIGEGDPFRAGILLGPPRTKWNSSGIDHSTHLHLSLARLPRPPGSTEDEGQWEGVGGDDEHC